MTYNAGKQPAPVDSWRGSWAQFLLYMVCLPVFMLGIMFGIFSEALPIAHDTARTYFKICMVCLALSLAIMLACFMLIGKKPPSTHHG